MLVPLLAGVAAIAAYFASRQANQIATAGTFPRLSVVSTASLAFALPATAEEQYYFCRTEVRLANIGGASTSIIDVDPVGDFNDRGYLPSAHGSFLRVVFAADSLASLLGAFILYRHAPLSLLASLARVVRGGVEQTVLEGPVPYALAVTTKGGDGLLPTDDGAEDANPPIRSIDDLRRVSISAPGPATAAARRLFDLMLPVSDPVGLPYLIPANTVEDIAIDFKATFPPGVDLMDPRSMPLLERAGVNLRVGYTLKFPDAPPIHIESALCGQETLQYDSEVIHQFLEEQGWWPPLLAPKGPGGQ